MVNPKFATWLAPVPETSANTQTTHLSFAEVMQLVQDGKEVPGVSKLDIQPCNQSPTPSQLQRALKPWETKIIAYFFKQIKSNLLFSCPTISLGFLLKLQHN
uniref:Peroxisomal membrane protein PEX14-like KPWE domain-containing protein n=1 Tax=Nothobranchius furzeri TaxID=105023 RepID=A0A8C6MKL5_NOTFU